MPSPPVPLSSLVANAVPYEWHDAVAIVAQILEQLRADLSLGEKRVPELNAIALEPSGAITFDSNAQPSSPAMPGVAVLLQQLLAGREQPPHLRLLAMQASNADPAPSLEAFAADLSGWERPNRQAKLAALYATALTTHVSPQPLVSAQPPASPQSAIAGAPPVDSGPGNAVSDAAHVEPSLQAPDTHAQASAEPHQTSGDRRTAGNEPPKRAARQSSFATLTTRDLAILATCGVVVIGSAAWIATGQPIPFVSGGTASSAMSATTATSAAAAPALSAASESALAGADGLAQPPDGQVVAASDVLPADAPSTRASSAPTSAPSSTEAPAPPSASRAPRPAPAPPASVEQSAGPAGATRQAASSASGPRTQAAAAASAAPGTARASSSPSATAARPSSVFAAPPPTGSSAPPVTPSPARPGPAPARAAQPAAGSAGGVQVAPSQPVPNPASPPPSPQIAAIPDQAWPPGNANPGDPTGREYRAGDPGVVEPVPLARLPRKADPSTPRDRLQVLEVHVNTDGTVESARFILRPPTYRNRWWVSAAKSWRFRPALKDGKPVRFVMQIPFDEAGGL